MTQTGQSITHVLKITLSLSPFSYIPFNLHQKIQFAPRTLNNKKRKPKIKTEKNDQLQQGGDGEGGDGIQALTVEVQLGFLTYQVDGAFTRVHTCLGENAFLPGRRNWVAALKNWESTSLDSRDD